MVVDQFMPAWSKEADWIPLSNALAQVDFYLENLQKAQDYLDYVETFAQYNLQGYQAMWDAAVAHIARQGDALRRAQAKLEATKKRVNPPS
jgi:hypothetical protein